MQIIVGFQLYDQVDLAIITDYRQVLTELLILGPGNPYIGSFRAV